MAPFKQLSHSQLQRRLDGLLADLARLPQTDDVRRLLEELQIHQIELELQNRELRDAHRELEQARDRYADLYDFAPVGYLTLERAGKIVEINLTGATMLGTERSRIVGMPLSAFLAPGQPPLLLTHLRDVFAGTGKLSIDLTVKPRRGTSLDVRLESLAIASNGDPINCRSVLLDITERKRADAALRQAYGELEEKVRQRTADLAAVNNSLRASEERLAHAQAVSHVGSLDWTPQTGEQIWSDETFRLFGFEPGAVEANYDTLLNSVHPDDRTLVDGYLNSVLTTNTTAALEFRVIRPDHTQRIVRSHAARIPGRSSQTLRIVCTLQDVTDRKRAEQALQQAATVFDNTDQGIFITDAARKITAVNPAFSRITGYSFEEVTGRNPRLLRSDRHDGDFYRALWQCLETTGQWQGEMWNRDKSGRVHPVWENITQVRDSQGQAINYVAVFSDISAIKEAEAQLQYLAHHDPLTGAPNRLLFEARLENAVQRATRHGSQIALLYVDLDRFKVINDTLGHTAGDLLLKTVAQRLQACARSEDTVARFGGDEFAVILDEIAHAEDAAPIASKMLSSIAQPVHFEPHDLVSSASIGISIYPDDAETSQGLCKAADAALYAAKHRGRGNYQFHTAELTAKAQDLLAVERDLRRALQQDELTLYYQPQVSVETGRIVGVEALVRWRHPTRGLLLPDQFLVAAEETGLVDAITDWVLLTACAQTVAWRDSGLPLLRMSVNMAPRTLLHDPDIVGKVQRALQTSGLPSGRLELEVTEKAIQTQPQSLQRLAELKALGVTLAIDDFGTGYSCLSSLKQLPVDVLKIDQSFIADLASDPSDAAISAAIITMGHSLSLRIVAEGVGESQSLEFLQNNGCDEIQGFIFSPPVVADRIPTLLTRLMVH